MYICMYDTLLSTSIFQTNNQLKIALTKGVCPSAHIAEPAKWITNNDINFPPPNIFNAFRFSIAALGVENVSKQTYILLFGWISK